MTQLELKLIALFERIATSHSSEPIEEQWYWPKVRRLVRLAEGGLHPSAWVIELLEALQ